MSLVLRQHACNGEYHLITYDSTSFHPDWTWMLSTAYLSHWASKPHNLQARLIFVTRVWGWSHLTAGSCSISRLSSRWPWNGRVNTTACAALGSVARLSQPVQATPDMLSALDSFHQRQTVVSTPQDGKHRHGLSLNAGGRETEQTRAHAESTRRGPRVYCRLGYLRDTTTSLAAVSDRPGLWVTSTARVLACRFA